MGWPLTKVTLESNDYYYCKKHKKHYPIGSDCPECLEIRLEKEYENKGCNAVLYTIEE